MIKLLSTYSESLKKYMRGLVVGESKDCKEGRS